MTAPSCEVWSQRHSSSVILHGSRRGTPSWESKGLLSAGAQHAFGLSQKLTFPAKIKFPQLITQNQKTNKKPPTPNKTKTTPTVKPHLALKHSVSSQLYIPALKTYFLYPFFPTDWRAALQWPCWGLGSGWRVQAFPSLTANSSLRCWAVATELSGRFNAQPAEKERKSRAHPSRANGYGRKWEGPSLIPVEK